MEGREKEAKRLNCPIMPPFPSLPSFFFPQQVLCRRRRQRMMKKKGVLQQASQPFPPPPPLFLFPPPFSRPLGAQGEEKKTKGGNGHGKNCKVSMGFANGLEMANMTIKIYEFGLKETSAILGNFLSLPFASTTTSIHLRLTARTEKKDRRRRKEQAVGGEGGKEGRT